MIHRSFGNQRADYQFVVEKARGIGKEPRKGDGRAKAEVAAIAKEIIDSVGEMSYFALHKLFYLVELAHAKSHNQRLTRAYFIRQKDGPYCVDLHPLKLRKAISDLTTFSREGRIFVRRSGPDLFQASKMTVEVVSPEVRDEIARVVGKYGRYSDSDLKTRVYLTTPMRRILREEVTAGHGLFNSPIDFGTSP